MRGRTRVLPRGGSTLASTNARACVSRSEPSRVCGSGAEVAKRGTTSARFAEKKKEPLRRFPSVSVARPRRARMRDLRSQVLPRKIKIDGSTPVRIAGAKTDRRHRQCFARTCRARWRSTSRLPGASRRARRSEISRRRRRAVWGRPRAMRLRGRRRRRHRRETRKRAVLPRPIRDARRRNPRGEAVSLPDPPGTRRRASRTRARDEPRRHPWV